MINFESKKGSFILKHQKGGKGTYASIDLTLIPITHGLEINYKGDDKWNSAIQFAAEYFFERYSYREKFGLRVTVDELHTMSVDSSLTVVFFVFIKAANDAMNYVDHCSFDGEGNFIIPK